MIGGPASSGNGYAYGDDDPLDNLDPTGNSSCRSTPTARHKTTRKASRGHGHFVVVPWRAPAPHSAYDDGRSAADLYDYEYRLTMPYDDGHEDSLTYNYGDDSDPGYHTNHHDDGGAYGGGLGDLGGELEGGLFGASASACDEPAKPAKPKAEDGIYKAPINARPSGQSAMANQLGTKDGNSGPADAPVNTDTVAVDNPAALQDAYQGQEQPDTGGDQPAAGDAFQDLLDRLSESDAKSLQILRDAVDAARAGTIEDIQDVLTDKEFAAMVEAFDEKTFFRVRQFYGKYMERAAGQDLAVRSDENIEHLDSVGKKEPDFLVGEHVVDVTTDSVSAERDHLRRSYIDSTDNLMTYPSLGIPEMYDLFDGE